jgi:para-aminobenzoate synthetase component 1
LNIRLTPEEIQRLKETLPYWCESYTFACILDSNNLPSACSYDRYELIAGVSQANAKTFNSLDGAGLTRGWKLGYVSYEHNHAVHGLSPGQKSKAGFDACFFFEPQILLLIKKGDSTVEIDGGDESTLSEIMQAYRADLGSPSFKLDKRISRETYLSHVEHMKERITEGDFYEINYCQEFYAENCEIDPTLVFHKLKKISPTPFASYMKHSDRHLICASPERFLKREGSRIAAQPIKGTIRRSTDKQEDLYLKEQLMNSEKERAENIMIVDLMRNDLSRCAQTGTVDVKELLGVYSFSTVHQLISTVEATLRPGISLQEIFDYTFPMGSMTGAPKREVMHAIDNYEGGTRGIFSGSVGYISPDEDFDFNVVIRSIIYNRSERYLSFHVGSAITYDADAEQEYQECLLKAGTMLAALGVTL